MFSAMRGTSWVGFVVMLWVVPVAAQSDPAKQADAELERRFRSDLEQVSPAAADAFDQANAARDAQRFDEALVAYRRAGELAPGVDHPHRRACSVLASLDRGDDALVECEAALRLAPDSPYDKSMIAAVLGDRNRPGDLDRALRLAREAVEQLPADPSTLGTWCQVLLRTQDLAELETCGDRLLAADPNGLGANYVGAVVAASKRDFSRARRHAGAARAAGLDEDAHRKLLAGIADMEANAESAEGSDGLPVPGAAVLWTLVVWLGVMGVLLGAGYALSWLTLRAVGRVAATEASSGTGTAREQRLRKLYKVVLLLCGVYFYLSIPILLMTIVAAGCGVVYLFFAMGVIPIKFVFCIGILVVVTIGVVLRSLVVGVEQGPLGYRVDLDRQPRLRELLQDVAGEVGTRSVGAVYLTPGTDMAVNERSGLWSSLRGARAERSLIMGIGLFDGLTQLQLRSVLAHEHGHFRNQDTAGGWVALAVRRSLYAMIIRLASSGVASAFNPVWWFLRAYHRVYLGVSQGASRLQEVLADRWAIQAYGTAAFVAGYRHVVARSVQFEHQVQATIQEVVDAGRPLPNLYQYRPQSSGISEGDLASAIDEEMTRAPSAYDSHPSPRQRIAWAEALAVERGAQPGGDESIWALFDGREELERAMTAEVREQIYANHGITIGEAEAEAEAESSADEREGHDHVASQPLEQP
jgi:Zn-dependent protease with chaperone function